ncbi:MAG: hypothetical protein ACHQQ3_04300 [Gemmatimonadales bacterium]
MKSLLSRFLPLAVALGAVACRAHPIVEPERVLGPAVKEPAARVVVDSTRGEVVLYAGPFRVPAMAADGHDHMAMGHEMMDAMPHAPAGSASANMDDHAVHAYSPLVRFEWPVAGWYRGFRYSLVDASGLELPKSLMHHMIGVDFERRQLVNGEALRFLGTGTETGDIVLPRLLGVPMRGGQKLGVYTAWHNELGRDFDGVYLRIAMPYVPSTALIKPVSAFPVYMDVNDVPGASNAFDVPPGHSEQSHEFTVPIGGKFIAVGGHLHDFGRDVRLEDVATGKVLVQLDAKRDSADHLLAIPNRYFLIRGIRVAGGHPYRVVGEYHSRESTTRVKGGMAHVVGLFVPENADAWPPADSTDPEMVADLASLPGGAKALAPVVGPVAEVVASPRK